MGKPVFSKIFLWAGGALLLFLAGGMLIIGVTYWRLLRTFAPQEALDSTSTAGAMAQSVSLQSLLPELIGLTGPKTYLLLFANNTELRPGGGFIGSYAVVRIDRGRPEILKIEGTEIIDRAADPSVLPNPPTPLKTHLGVDRWFFRDANWSPDFMESARQAFDLYVKERGSFAAEVDAVVAVTPTVMERLVGRVGPITVEHLTFDANNITEQLEYEVEYGFLQRGVAKKDRKGIMEPLMRAIITKASQDFLLHPDVYGQMLKDLVDEKHVLVFAPDENLQWRLTIAGLAGRLYAESGDYLLWADANLGALKTDHALKRTLSYHIVPEGAGGYRAVAEMRYEHTGTFDWRTTRYLSYARVFVPAGAVFKKVSAVSEQGKSRNVTEVEQGSELGKTWFGGFVSIDPGETQIVRFEYALPEPVIRGIRSGAYTLFVQKQLGSIGHGLTLDLDFGTTLSAAAPAELQEKWGDSRYEIESDLRVDRKFEITL